MKSKSVFKALPREDQQHILSLCATHTYDEVLEIIARPRPEGLQLKTSYSALCRFNCSQNADARKTAILDQAASSLQYIRQGGAGSFRTAILTLLETRLFEAIRAGTPIAELKEEFAILKDFQKGFLAEEKWRSDPEVNPKKEYFEHCDHAAKDRHYDFVPADEQGNPTDIPPLSEDEITDLNAVEEITEGDIARLDYQIAAFGRDTAEQLAPDDGYPEKVIQERIKVYEENLRTRGITPVEAAIEARRAKLLATTNAKSHIPPEKIHLKPPKKARKST